MGSTRDLRLIFVPDDCQQPQVGLCSVVPCSHRTSCHSHCGSLARAGITSHLVLHSFGLFSSSSALYTETDFCLKIKIELTVSTSLLWEVAAGGRQGQKRSAGHHQWQRFALCLLNKCFGVPRPFRSIFHWRVFTAFLHPVFMLSYLPLIPFPCWVAASSAGRWEILLIVVLVQR